MMKSPLRIGHFRPLGSVGLLFLMAFIALPHGFSQDWASSDFSLVSESSRPGRYTYILDLNLTPIEVQASNQMDDRDVIQLERAFEFLDELSIIEVQRIQAAYRDQGIEFQALTPINFSYDGENLGALLPQGIGFEYRDFLQYKVDLIVDNLRIRASGQYLSEDQLLTTLVRIARNPGEYLQSQNPEFVLQRFLRIEDNIAQLEFSLDGLDGKVDDIASALTEEDRLLSEEDQRLSAELQDLLNQGQLAVASARADLVAARADVELALETLQTNLETNLSEQVNALQDSLSTLEEELQTSIASLQQSQTEELDSTRKGLFRLNYRGFFGNFRDVDFDVLQTVIDWKIADPSLNKDQLVQMAEENQVELGDREIELILLVYFGEYY